MGHVRTLARDAGQIDRLGKRRLGFRFFWVRIVGINAWICVIRVNPGLVAQRPLILRVALCIAFILNIRTGAFILHLVFLHLRVLTFAIGSLDRARRSSDRGTVFWSVAGEHRHESEGGGEEERTSHFAYQYRHSPSTSYNTCDFRISESCA